MSTCVYFLHWDIYNRLYIFLFNMLLCLINLSDFDLAFSLIRRKCIYLCVVAQVRYLVMIPWICRVIIITSNIAMPIWSIIFFYEFPSRRRMRVLWNEFTSIIESLRIIPNISLIWDVLAKRWHHRWSIIYWLILIIITTNLAALFDNLRILRFLYWFFVINNNINTAILLWYVNIRIYSTIHLLAAIASVTNLTVTSWRLFWWLLFLFRL